MGARSSEEQDAGKILADKWASSILSGVVSLVPITEGNSKRKNFRVSSSEGSFIIYSPTRAEEQLAMVRINRHFSLQGISVPRLIAWDDNSPLLMVEDLGTVSAEDATRTLGLEEVAKQACAQLARIHTWGGYKFDLSWCHKAPKLYFPVWDREHFGQFLTMLVGRYLKIKNLPPDLDQDLRRFKKCLAWDDSPRTSIHGDWHFRNLSYCQGQVYVLDWGDSQWGPIAKDLASFFMHPYNLHSASLRDTLLRRYFQLLNSPGLEKRLYRQLPYFEAGEILRSLTLYVCRARDKAPERAAYIPDLINRTREIFFRERTFYVFPVLQKLVERVLCRLEAEDWTIPPLEPGKSIEKGKG